MVGADGRVRLMDFGLACILDGHPLETSGRWSLRRDPSASAGHGTPGYMAPEQALGAAQDARCDIFSFCVVLFEALHGRRPVAGERASASIDAIPRAPNGWLRGRGARLDAVIRRGLVRDPALRWTTMDGLLAALAPAPAPRRRLLRAVGTLALAARARRPGHRRGGGRIWTGRGDLHKLRRRLRS